MKTLFTTAIIALTLVAGGVLLHAADTASKPYPASLKTCVVSDEKLGDHGDPYVIVHEGQEVKLCCKGCLKDFKKEPAKFMKMISDAAAKK